MPETATSRGAVSGSKVPASMFNNDVEDSSLTMDFLRTIHHQRPDMGVAICGIVVPAAGLHVPAVRDRGRLEEDEAVLASPSSRDWVCVG